jgi:hypothetical protein
MSLSVRRNPNPKRERGIARPSLTRRVRMGPSHTRRVGMGPSLTRRVRMGPSLTRRVGMGPSLTRRVGIVIVLALLDPPDRRMAKQMIVL